MEGKLVISSITCPVYLIHKEAFFLEVFVLFHHLFCIHFLGGPLLCSLPGGSTSVFTSGGSTSMFTSGGGPLPCSLLGSSTSMFTSVFTSGGSHVTYPIMLLYTAIECPSASWAKFTWDTPAVGQIDRQTLVKTLPSRTTCAGGKFVLLWLPPHLGNIKSTRPLLEKRKAQRLRPRHVKYRKIAT